MPADFHKCLISCQSNHKNFTRVNKQTILAKRTKRKSDFHAQNYVIAVSILHHHHLLEDVHRSTKAKKEKGCLDPWLNRQTIHKYDIGGSFCTFKARIPKKLSSAQQQERKTKERNKEKLLFTAQKTHRHRTSSNTRLHIITWSIFNFNFTLAFLSRLAGFEQKIRQS